MMLLLKDPPPPPNGSKSKRSQGHGLGRGVKLTEACPRSLHLAPFSFSLASPGEAFPKPVCILWLRLWGRLRVGPSCSPGKGNSPDVAIVGGITQVSANVLEHFFGSGTAPGVEDLHTAHPAHTIKDHEDRGPGLIRSEVMRERGSGPHTPPPPKHQAKTNVLFFLCINTFHLRAAPSRLSPALLRELRQPLLEDPIKTQIPRKPDFWACEWGLPQPEPTPFRTSAHWAPSIFFQPVLVSLAFLIHFPVQAISILSSNEGGQDKDSVSWEPRTQTALSRSTRVSTAHSVLRLGLTGNQRPATHPVLPSDPRLPGGAL